MSIECVTFDLDDTLWAVGPVITRAEEEFYTWLAQRCPRITTALDRAQMVAHRRGFSQQYPHQLHDLTALRKRWLAHVFDEFGYSEESVETAFRVFWEHRNAVQLFAEVTPAMERLRERYTLGVITNGNACVQHIGIAHWFDFVVSAEHAGAAKPAPRIFQAALAHAGVEAARVAHVGDDPANDVRGAAGVGMRTVWYNPARAPWPGGPDPDAAPDAVIASLADLDGALARIG
jgi:putative hydrolase of the HAD superfamily